MKISNGNFFLNYGIWYMYSKYDSVYVHACKNPGLTIRHTITASVARTLQGPKLSKPWRLKILH